MMKRPPHIKKIPLLKARIFLLLFCCLNINCVNKFDFERNISFENGWQQLGVSKKTPNAKVFIKNFPIDWQNDKIYLLELWPGEDVLQLQVNNTFVEELMNKNHTLSFNITDLLKKQNSFRLTVAPSAQHFKAKLHYLNKLYIPEVKLSPTYSRKDKSTIKVHVKIQNAFNIEKQGVLKLTLYSDKDRALAQKEIPVFIAGNALNLYQQEFEINKNQTELEHLKVTCQLEANNKIFDKYETGTQDATSNAQITKSRCHNTAPRLHLRARQDTQRVKHY